MKIVKKATLFALSIVVVAVLIFGYYIRFSARARSSYRNVENSKRIVKGMGLDEVIRIMGEPNATYPGYFDKRQTIYYYEPPFASSAGIEIYIDSTKTVNHIIPFE